MKKHPFFFLDFIFECFKKNDNIAPLSGSQPSRKWCPFWRKARESLLYNNPNNTNIELSHESINIAVPTSDSNQNYDACSSAVYAENTENNLNIKVNL